MIFLIWKRVINVIARVEFLKNQRRGMTVNIKEKETPQRVRGKLLFNTLPDLFRHPLFNLSMAGTKQSIFLRV